MADSDFVERLRLAVYGQYDVKDHLDEDLGQLLWRVGEMRRQIHNAHAALDILDVPKMLGDGVLTVSGRITRMAAA